MPKTEKQMQAALRNWSKFRLRGMEEALRDLRYDTESVSPTVRIYLDYAFNDVQRALDTWEEERRDS